MIVYFVIKRPIKLRFTLLINGLWLQYTDIDNGHNQPICDNENQWNETGKSKKW